MAYPDSPLLDVRIVPHGRHTVVHVAGELDISTTPLLEDVLERAVAGGRPPFVILELTGLRFSAVSGMRAVVTYWRRIRRAGGRLAIVADPRGQVARLLGLIDVDALVPVHGSVESALVEGARTGGPVPRQRGADGLSDWPRSDA
jgi:anti-anti-sigma factor